VVTTVDTIVSVDTVVVTTVDTLVTVDTIVQVDTVSVSTTLVASLSNLNLRVGQSATLSVTAQNPLGFPTVPNQVTWLSGAPNIASVNDSGRVRGVAAGQTSIFAVASGLSVTVPTTVTDSLPTGGGGGGVGVATQIVATPTSVTLAVGETVNVTAQVRDANGLPVPGATVSWSSAEPTVASVSSSGVVTGVQVGTTEVRATYQSLATSVSVAVTGASQPATRIFFDGFESGNLSNPTVTAGGRWLTSSNVTASTDRARTGSTSLKFAFGPNAPGEDSWAEQRFSLGTNLTEIWVEFYIYIPTNYQHRDDSGSDNNKWLRLWGDSYNATNKHGASTLPAAGGNSDLFAEYGKNEGPIGAGWGDAPIARNFITNAERGRWNQFRWHSKMATTASAENGLIEMWWNGVLVDRDLSMDIYSSAANYINEGYLIGWANSGFTSQTLLYIDDVSFYSTNPGW